MTDSSMRRIGISELEERLGVNRSTISKWYRSGKFPRPEYIGTYRKWKVEVVEAWEAKQAERGKPSP